MQRTATLNEHSHQGKDCGNNRAGPYGTKVLLSIGQRSNSALAAVWITFYFHKCTGRSSYGMHVGICLCWQGNFDHLAGEEGAVTYAFYPIREEFSCTHHYAPSSMRCSLLVSRWHLCRSLRRQTI